jgi:putative transposase
MGVPRGGNAHFKSQSMITKYRYNVLEGALRERIRTMIREVCKGRHFWGRGYFSTTSGNITDDVILQYLREHEPTGAGR